MFRVVEYLEGFLGYLLLYRMYLYLFDSVLMLCVIVIFNIVYLIEVVALVSRGKAVKKSWKIERIVGYHETLSSDVSGGGLA
jgi:hypothetical protein